MRATPLAILALPCSPALAEVVPHTGQFSLRWEQPGQPPQPWSGTFTGSAEVLTVTGPNPEAVSYEYPSGLVLQPGAPGSFFTFLPMGGLGQHVPVAPFHWENTLTFHVTYTFSSSIVWSATAQGSFRSFTSGRAYDAPAMWALLSEIRITPGGDPQSPAALVIEQGSTLITIPTPAAWAVVLTPALWRRRRWTRRDDPS
jgi:hypothetical protein